MKIKQSINRRRFHIKDEIKQLTIDFMPSKEPWNEPKGYLDEVNWEYEDRNANYEYYCTVMRERLVAEDAMCNTCKFYEDFMCKRFPKSVSKSPDDRCGEFKPKTLGYEKATTGEKDE